MATVATCPCCGFDLFSLRDFALGDLTVENGVIIKWKGERVKLTPAQRLMLIALARADGAAVSRASLAEATGYEGDRPTNIVAVYANRIKKAFRAVDPEFDAFEPVHSIGLRWRTESGHLLAA
jgi:DNA-binding response OmpR family regulator